MELVLPSRSATRETEPVLRWRRFESGVPWDDRDRNRLLLLDSFCSIETAEALLSMGRWPRLGWASEEDAVVGVVSVVVDGVDAGDGGGDRKLMRTLERRLVLFDKPPGLNRPAVA